MTKPFFKRLNVGISKELGCIDLGRYSLGQGGLCSDPMIDAHIPQLKQLEPRSIRFFVQEYFGLYPERGRFHWDKLDRTLSAIVATGARPFPSICFKPPALFPKVDHRSVHPASYQEWGELIFHMVKHCMEKGFGIERWEIGNEVDFGETGGCPYLFTPDDYTVYYTHTVEAILKADPDAKVGGPGLADWSSPIGDALIEHCAGGKAPLHFFSWHHYNDNPEVFRCMVKGVKEKLAKHSSLKHVETMMTEWNMHLGNPNLNPYFQPAFILEATRVFHEEGLSSSNYFHIRDSFVDPGEFASFFSRKGAESMAHWWNSMPQYDGLYDNQGRVRPAYYVFLWLRLFKGTQIEVSAGGEGSLRSFAARDGDSINVLLWNFPDGDGSGMVHEGIIDFPEVSGGSFRSVRLNPESFINNMEVLRAGCARGLKNDPIKFSLKPYEINWIEIRLASGPDLF